MAENDQTKIPEHVIVGLAKYQLEFKQLDEEVMANILYKQEIIQVDATMSPQQQKYRYAMRSHMQSFLLASWMATNATARVTQNHWVMHFLMLSKIIPS